MQLINNPFFAIHQVFALPSFTKKTDFSSKIPSFKGKASWMTSDLSSTAGRLPRPHLAAAVSGSQIQEPHVRTQIPGCPSSGMGLPTPERPLKSTYPLTRNCYANNSLIIIFRNYLRDFVLSKCPGKKDIFKELRVRFLIYPKIIISEYLFS